MKKNGMKVMAVIGSAVMAAGMLAGCGNSGAAATTAATATTAKQTTEAKAEETTKEASQGARHHPETGGRGSGRFAGPAFPL